MTNRLAAIGLSIAAAFVALLPRAVDAAAPSFTGQSVRASGASALVNLRGQGAIGGTAPLNVQVNAVRVGGVLSPLINVVRSVLQPGAQASVCLQVQNLLGLDLTFLGVEIDVTAFNADAPNGISGRIRVQTGLGNEDVSPLACADAVVLPPTANAGADQNIADTDQQPGEMVALDGSASADPDGTIVAHEWFTSAGALIASAANVSMRLADGTHTLTLRVTDDVGSTSVDTVNVTVTAPSSNQLPTARAGVDRVVPDSDRAPGEIVVLDGSGSIDPDGTIAQFEWLLGSSTVVARGINPSVQLPDGPQTITLRVTDNAGGVATAVVTLTVAAANPGNAPLANAGADRNISDTDAIPGETVLLDASASADVEGAIAQYQWFVADEVIATGVAPTVRLPDGETFITLVVTDNEGNAGSDGVLIAVSAAPLAPLLSALPGLTPNQLSVAVTLDSLCPRLRQRGTAQALTEGEADLLAHCNAITFTSTLTEQVEALDAISPQDLNATRIQALSLSRIHVATIADRLSALRAGASGISLAGLNITLEGKPLPITELAQGLNRMLGGGASADAGDADSLFDARLGLWLRGNYSQGRKEGTIADHGFDSDQWGLTAGADFRFSPRQIVGIALGYGNTRAQFGRGAGGYLDSTALSAALYATLYSESGLYADLIANYASSNHDSNRRIQFAYGLDSVDLTALGGTSGGTAGLAFTVGYDFTPGAFTLAPSVGFNYLSAGVEAFREQGAAGLDLRFDEQNFSSATANAGMRLSYAWKTHVGVIQPQVRGEYIRELISGTETFGARFANDPFNDTPRIIVTADAPDRSYWRIASGLAAQFTHGIAGFIEYQRFESLRHIDYSDIAFGVRVEANF
jgi:outer membrane autotransporter protein